MLYMQDIPLLELDECFPFLMRRSAPQLISLLLMWPGKFFVLPSLNLLEDLVIALSSSHRDVQQLLKSSVT